ncbi:MAG: RsiV family protein [Prevotellaceae bacterium]|jgi:hypothetical protein|nr:RsiV family protein [Prevotellaceae bacterium]
MKNISIKIFLFVIFIFGIFSCQNQVVKLKQQRYEEKCFLVPADTAKGSLNVKVEVEYPSAFTSAAVLDSIRRTLLFNMFGEQYVNVPFDSVAQIYVQNATSDYKKESLEDLRRFEQMEPNFQLGEYQQSIEGFALFNDAHLFVYGYTRYEYSGGAHGSNYTFYFNFDLTNGRWLGENDIFVNEYQQPLVELIKNTILEANKLPTLDNSYYLIDSIKPNGNFYISDEGITYLFNIYEIAPYYVGQTEVFLPYSKLKGIIRKDSPVSYLVASAK